MPDPIVDAALARGALIVTPNKRLAREIAARHDRAQVEAGKSTWPAARVVPWTTFVSQLVQAAQDAGLAVPPLYLDSIQATQLWRRIVRTDLADKPLVDADAIASLAVEAWELLHAYGAGMDGWRGLAGSEDVEAFARWAGSYWKELGRLEACDAALAPDLLAGVARELPRVTELDVVLAGFVKLAPQQQRLLEALETAGTRMTQGMSESHSIAASEATLAACETPAEELSGALAWARGHALEDPQARIGVVVLDLAQRREAVRSACEDILCAPLQWPGRHEVPRPYEISLGLPLADIAIVECALALLAIGRQPIELPRAAALIRSPYLPGGESDWLRRASLERTWLDRGLREVDWHTLVNDLESVDKHLAARWRWAIGELPRESRIAPRDWVEQWRSWLNDTAWCEGRALSSDDYQADGAWNELLGAFARLAGVSPTLSFDDALATLRNLAREQLFQPESPGARVHVLGPLEAAGLTFDALWVAGMAADAWPRSPEPNPLLPVAWQRERQVPRSSPEVELAFARELTSQFAHSASDVVFSFAAAADDHRRAPSPLVARLPLLDPARSIVTTAAKMFEQRPELESISDPAAPSIALGTRLPGGTGVIGAQSDCPFRATAVYRLKAEPWPAAVIGVTPIERGNLVHAALDAFWRTVRSHAALAAMDDAALARNIDAAFEQARVVLSPARWAALPEVIEASEKSCVVRLIGEWLREVERGRPPFTVVDTEQRTIVTLGGYTLEIRLDRVDALADGSLAVIDYKTGFATTPQRWFEPRPQGMQVALYASAREQAAPDASVRALVYAQLRPGDIKVVGLRDSQCAWPALTVPTDVKGVTLVDWHDAASRLQRSLGTLATAFGAGDAAILPRDRKKVCSLCGLRALCRIGGDTDEPPGDGERFADE